MTSATVLGRELGREWGRQVSDFCKTQINADFWRSNSGRIAAGDLLREHVHHWSMHQSAMGPDPRGAAAFVAAAKAELAWLGV